MLDKRRIDEVIELVGLPHLQNDLVRELSVGWRQRLGLATAIVHNPKLLFLDEPTSGVDPTARRSFWDLIYELLDQGVTALVTTHYMDEAEYCQRVGIMRDGKLLAMDTPSILKERILPGKAWDIFAEPLLPALDALEACPYILRAGLAGDHLRAITPVDVSRDNLIKYLFEGGIEKVSLSGTYPTLEDVFLTLAGRRDQDSGV